jgi:hypothetical protein
MGTKAKIEFGDFQTPFSLAKEVCALLVQRGFRPDAVLEPTCGVGAFLSRRQKRFLLISKWSRT